MFDIQRERFLKLIEKLNKEYDDLLTLSILNDKDKQLLTYIRANRDLDDDLQSAQFEIKELNQAIEANTTGLHQLLDKLGVPKSKHVGDVAYDGTWSRLQDHVKTLQNKIKMQELCVEAVTSKLLDVQQDCIKANKRIKELEK